MSKKSKTIHEAFWCFRLIQTSLSIKVHSFKQVIGFLDGDKGCNFHAFDQMYVCLRPINRPLSYHIAINNTTSNRPTKIEEILFSLDRCAKSTAFSKNFQINIH